MSRQESNRYFEMAEVWKNKRKRVEFLAYLALTALFLITRFWKLTELPFGMHIDEASMAYTSWCLAEYGVDRYLNSWPVYVPHYYGGQSAMYVYACALLFKLFGYHLILVRLPAVLFSFLNFIFGVLTARKLFPQNNIIPFVTGGLIVVCPYFIMAARFGYDCNLMLGMSTVFLYCLIGAVESGRVNDYVLAGVMGGFVLYTYALSYIALPVFLVLALIYLLRVKRFSFKGWFVMAITMGLLAVPLILVQVVNIFDLQQFQLGCFTITKLERNRAAEIHGFRYENLRDAFGAVFIGDELAYNTAPGYESLYGLTIVFFLIGADIVLRRLWKSVRNRQIEMQALPLFWLVSMLFLGAHIEINVNRMNGAFYGAVLLTAVGIDSLCMVMKKHAAAVAVAICGIYLWCFGNFASYYYWGGIGRRLFRFPILISPLRRQSDL